MAEKKKHLIMRGVKQASKRLEDDVLGRSKDIAENPGILRPMCAGNCRKCVFDKVFKDIDKINRYKDDDQTLIKLASKGFDDMAKAYAGTISLNAAGKVPLLATAVIAGERVPYAVRGAVAVPLLIGCQHYDDPKLRLLYYNGLIKKAGLHLYSFGESTVCSDDPNMPEDYLYDTWWETPYKFPDDDVDCGHKGSVSLNIKVRSADITIHICEDCAKDVSSLAYLVSRLCAADPLDDFEVTVEHKYHSENDSGTVKITGDDLKQYMVGKMTDRMLIEKVKREKLGELAKNGGLTLIIGEKNYGSDLDSFIGDLDGPENEKSALTGFLRSNPRAVVLKNGKTSEATAYLWDSDWKGIIAAYTSDSFAERYTERPRSSFSIVIEEAHREFVSQDVVKNLPVFQKPGPVTKLADDLAKAAKVGGLGMLLEAVSKATLRDSKSKSLAAAFVFAVDPEGKPDLTLSADDMDFADFLRPFAKKVLDADGQTYREEMNTLLMACSSGESV